MYRIALALALLLAAAPALTRAQANDLRTRVAGGDPTLETAMAEADATLERFLTEASQNGLGRPGAGLRVAFTNDAGLIEVLWLSPFRLGPDGGGVGVLTEPSQLTGAEPGARLDFARGAVVDWSLPQDGVLFGHFTTRALLPRFDAATQANLREMLSAAPLPDGW